MPEMSGETTLSKLKGMSEFNTPVIALTADAVSGAKEKYISEGFVDYIAKPFRKDEIKEKLGKLFIDSETPNNSENSVSYVFNPMENEEYVVINGERKDCDENNNNIH